jgi:glutathione S-transferase
MASIQEVWCIPQLLQIGNDRVLLPRPATLLRVQAPTVEARGSAREQNQEGARMLVLHGFSSSNYYNVVKLALLEKQLPFEERLVYTGAGDDYRPDYLEHSPIGKVPCLETSAGFLTESRCIIDYLERTYPEHPLYPGTPFAIAKQNELAQVIELYLELAVRPLIPNMVVGKPPPEVIARTVRANVTKGVRALARLARFEGYILGGDQLTAADLAAVVHLPTVSGIAKAVLGEDPLAGVEGLADYLKRMSQRPTVQRVQADRKADMPSFYAHMQKLFAPRA